MQLTAQDQLALKAAFDLIDHDHRHHRQSLPDTSAVEVTALHTLCQQWLAEPTPRHVEAPPEQLTLLAAYVSAAMRLRGYVVGRPAANNTFVACYRKLTTAARPPQPWWRRLWPPWFLSKPP